MADDLLSFTHRHYMLINRAVNKTGNDCQATGEVNNHILMLNTMWMYVNIQSMKS